LNHTKYKIWFGICLLEHSILSFLRYGTQDNSCMFITQAGKRIAMGEPSLPMILQNMPSTAMVHELSMMADIMMEDSVWLDAHQSLLTPQCAHVELLDNCHAPNLEPNTQRSPPQTPQLHSMHDLTVLQSEDDSLGERERDRAWSRSRSPCQLAEFVDNNGRPAAAKITAALLSRVAVVGILGNGNGTSASRTISSSSWVSKSCPCLFSEEQHAAPPSRTRTDLDL